MINTNLKNKLINYLILEITIYFLFKYVSKSKVDDRDALIMATIIVLTYAVFENFYSMYFNKNTQSNIQALQCASTCSSGNENMASVPSLESLSKSLADVKAQLKSQQQLQQQVHQPIQQQVHKVQQEHTTHQEQKPTHQEQKPTQQPVQQPIATKNNGMVRNTDGSYTISPVIPKQAEKVGSREEDDILLNESQYNYVDYNSLPVNLGSDDDSYTMLPPRYWFPVPAHPPVCVTEKKCPVCPTYTNVEYVDMKEWDNSRRITPPDVINVDFVKEKLNSGR